MDKEDAKRLRMPVDVLISLNNSIESWRLSAAYLSAILESVSPRFKRPLSPLVLEERELARQKAHMQRPRRLQRIIYDLCQWVREFWSDHVRREVGLIYLLDGDEAPCDDKVLWAHIMRLRRKGQIICLRPARYRIPTKYISGFRKPSEKTARKIEEKIKEFAKEIESVRFV